MLTLISLFTLLSCNDNDENTVQTNELVATWKLTKFEPGFSPTSTYNGEIQWTINLAGTINVVIQNGTNVSNTLPLNTNGGYSYTTNNNQITIDNITYNYEISNNELKIEDVLGQAADGKKLTFAKE